MNDKHQLLAALDDVFQRWEALLAGLSEADITARQLPSDLSIKDVVGHLRAWQGRSIARLEAALDHREPEYPGWPAGLDPESEEDIEQINAWIHATYRDQPWPRMHQDWRAGFLRFLELAEAVPEPDLLAVGRYPWLPYPLAAVLEGALEHHREHLEGAQDWMRRQGNLSSAG